MPKFQTLTSVEQQTLATLPVAREAIIVNDHRFEPIEHYRTKRTYWIRFDSKGRRQRLYM
jgi:hypothetical protein